MLIYQISDLAEVAPRAMDLTGHRYGQLTVLGFYDKKKHITRWVCRCDCGEQCIKYSNQMRSGHVVSCGCAQRKKAKEIGEGRSADLVGQVFGRLTVIAREGSRNGKALWRCLCECRGKTLVATGSLRSGNTTSCGCFHSEMVSEMFTNPDLTDEDRATSRNREDACLELRFWRKAVFERDWFKCQVCGCRGRVVAHHKDGWDWCEARRLDVDNGVTVCVKCHTAFHLKCGYGGNTEDQWVAFMAPLQEVANE